MGKFVKKTLPTAKPRKVSAAKKEFSGKADKVLLDTTSSIPNAKKKYNPDKPTVFKMNPNPKNDRFKGRRGAYRPPKLAKELMDKHSRGPGMTLNGVQTKYHQDKMIRKEVYIKYAADQAARAQILHTEVDGYIEADEGESTAMYLQDEIVDNVDITAASKHFKLNLDFGPYRMAYTRNGRHLLVGGRLGHIAAMDWVTKKLHCEINVMEGVEDITWLHVETMFAAAQKSYVYIYDNVGTELHCMKDIYQPNRLEFLPYHFLLATGSAKGFLTWLDISVGEIVGHYNAKVGPVKIMTQNPQNGVLCVGGCKGRVTMWCPSMRESLASMLCHRVALTSVAVDPKGINMVTTGVDKRVKIWDIRQLSGPVAEYQLRAPAHHLEMSQKGLLAIAMGNVCEIYKNPAAEETTGPYLRQRCTDIIHGMKFCNYEDVLGVATAKGFESLLVPGSGEPNYDALEANPFQTKKQRQEAEVKALLSKIPMEFIALDPDRITQMDVPTLKEKIEAKKNLMLVKAPEFNFEPRKKMKGKGGSANAAKSRKIVKETARREFVKEFREIKQQLFDEHKKSDEDYIPLEGGESSQLNDATPEAPVSVLDRFRPKKKKKVSS